MSDGAPLFSCPLIDPGKTYSNLPLPVRSHPDLRDSIEHMIEFVRNHPNEWPRQVVVMSPAMKRLAEELLP